MSTDCAIEVLNTNQVSVEKCWEEKELIQTRQTSSLGRQQYMELEHK